MQRTRVCKLPCVFARLSIDPSGNSGSSVRTCPSSGRPAGSGIGTVSGAASSVILDWRSLEEDKIDTRCCSESKVKLHWELQVEHPNTWSEVLAGSFSFFIINSINS